MINVKRFGWFIFIVLACIQSPFAKDTIPNELIDSYRFNWQAKNYSKKPFEKNSTFKLDTNSFKQSISDNTLTIVPELHVIEEWGNSPIMDTVVSGTLAYCMTQFGFKIFDISNPALPSVKSEYTTMNSIRGISVKDQFVFLTDFHNGFQVVDVSDPDHPYLTYTTNRIISYGLTIHENTLYMIDYYGQDYFSSAIKIYDISNLPEVTYVKTIEISYYPERYYLRKLSVHDNQLLFCGYNRGSYQNTAFAGTYDLLDPYTFTNKQMIEMPDSTFAKDICVANNSILCLTDNNIQTATTVNIFSQAEGGQLSLLNRKQVISGCWSMSPVNQNIFLTPGLGEITSIDVSDPLDIISGPTIDNTGMANRMTWLGDYIYVSDRTFGLKIFQNINEQPFSLIGQSGHIYCGAPNDLVQDGNHIFLAHGYSGCNALTTNPDQSIQHISTSNPSPYTDTMRIDSENNIVCFSNSDIIHVVDYTDVNNPECICQLTSNYYSGIYDVRIHANSVYVLYMNGLVTFDITNPNAPVEHPRMDLYDINYTYNYCMEIEGDTAFIFINKAYSGSLLKCMDISNPLTPVLISQLELPSYDCWNITLDGSIVYLASGFNGLHIVDASDTENLEQIGSYRPDLPTSVNDIAVFDGFVYAATSQGLQVYDIHDLESIHQVAKCKEHSVMNTVKLMDGMVWFNDLSYGTLITAQLYTPDTIQTTYLIPHIDWSDYWSSYLVADNTDDSPRDIVITQFKDSTIISEETHQIASGESRVFPLMEGTCGTAIINGSGVFLKESFLNTIEQGIAEFTLFTEKSNTLFYVMPNYAADILNWMGIAILNPNAEPAQCSLTARGADGTILGESDWVIDPYSRAVGQLSTFFPDIDFNTVARVKVASTQDLFGINISGDNSEKLLFTPSILEFSDSGICHISHIANEWNNWENWIIADNLRSYTQTVSLVLYSDGTEVVNETINVPGNSSIPINLNDYSELSPECGTITPQSSFVVIRQSYISTSQGGTAEFLLNYDSSQTLVYNFPSYTSDTLDWMGLAVNNTSDEDDTIILTAYKDGIVVSSTTLQVNARCRTAALLQDLFPSVYSDGIDRVIATGNQKCSGINISGSALKRLLFTQAHPIH